MHRYGVIVLLNYDRFEQLRRSRGITKKFIAQSLGRSATLCQDWKQKKSVPSAEQLSLVSDILGTTPAYLSGITDDPAPARNESDELEQMLTMLRDREDMRLLFRTSRDATPEDIRQAVKIIEALRRND